MLWLIDLLIAVSDVKGKSTSCVCVGCLALRLLVVYLIRYCLHVIVVCCSLGHLTSSYVHVFMERSLRRTLVLLLEVQVHLYGLFCDGFYCDLICCHSILTSVVVLYSIVVS